MEVIKGYKVFNPDWTTNEDKFQYKVGKEYHINDDIDPREKGFYFCEKLVQCFDHCDFTHQIKAAEVEGFGQIKREFGEIYCSHIRILREIPIEEISKLVNNGEGNTGICNYGDHNRGDCNQGNYNQGNGNRGDYNRGDCNQGDGNRGDCNQGDNNRGNYNHGYRHLGNHNHGSDNIGIGNKGDYIIGLWCTQKQPFYLFNKLCYIPLEEFKQSENYDLLMRLTIAKNPKKEWKTFTPEEKRITLSTENITPEVFKELFDIDVTEDR